MKETKSTCPYCGVGCGVIIQSDEKGDIVWDPQAGRPGKRWYGPNPLFPGGVNVVWKPELIYVCKPGWGGDWYGGQLPS